MHIWPRLRDELDPVRHRAQLHAKWGVRDENFHLRKRTFGAKDAYCAAVKRTLGAKRAEFSARDARQADDRDLAIRLARVLAVLRRDSSDPAQRLFALGT